MRISDVASTDLFAGTVRHPLQVIRVTLAGDGSGPARRGGGRLAVVEQARRQLQHHLWLGVAAHRAEHGAQAR